MIRIKLKRNTAIWGRDRSSAQLECEPGAVILGTRKGRSKSFKKYRGRWQRAVSRGKKIEVSSIRRTRRKKREKLSTGPLRET